MSNIKAKIDQINQLIKEVREYKAEHPSERLGYWLGFGSLLNAYREGDIGFDECVETMETKVRSRRYNELLLLLNKVVNNFDGEAATEAVNYLEAHSEDVQAAKILLGAE